MSTANDPPAESRRGFLKAAGSLAGAGPPPPAVVHAADKSGSKPPVLGEGAHRYEAHHGWGQVPGHVRWGDTHGVAVDRAGLIYIKHRSHAPEPMDAIVVFDPVGKFVRSFGKEYHGGGHGIDIRLES